MNKRTNKNRYRKLPEKLVETTKWRRVNIDCWGPKTVCNKNGYTYKIYVVSMVDPVTGWPELAQLYGPPTAYKYQQALNSVWLSRYPRPEEIGMDNSSEFKKEFRDLCKNMGLKQKESNSWNPQSNAILEQIHQVLGDGLQACNLDNKDIDADKDDPFDEYITAVTYAICCAYYQTHGHSPAQLIYRRDMLLPVECKIDWEKLCTRKQERINKSNKRENLKRIDHNYQKGDWVTIV